MSKRGVCLLPDRNTGTKKDWSGAFRPEALHFAKFAGIDAKKNLVQVNLRLPKPKMREVVENAIVAARTGYGAPLDCVAFFCHGYSTGIQLGYSTKEGIDQVRKLASVIAANSTKNVVVNLYACSTASSANKRSMDGDGGFADLLRDELCRAGAVDCRVVGHITAGHATLNPQVRIFDGNGISSGGAGGVEVARRGTPTYSKFARLLDGPYRFQFPFLPLSRIYADLA